MTLREFHNGHSNGITYLWVCGVGCPGGQGYTQNIETEIDEEYLDIEELVSRGLGYGDFWELEGEVKDGQWGWDGQENVRDYNGNAYYNIEAF